MPTKQELHQLLMGFLKDPAPRKVPQQFIYTNPLAKLFIILGAILVVVELGMCILFIVLFHMGLMSTRGMDGAPVNPAILFLPAYLAIFPAVILIMGLMNRKKDFKYLQNGILDKGIVLTVKPLPARMNDRTFFLVKVSHNTGRDQGLIAKGFIDNYTVDYFLEARDNKTPIDILSLPSKANRVLLVHKIEIMKRFD